MRLQFPRVDKFVSDDDSACITFQDVKTNRDTGGLLYQFLLKKQSVTISIQATVAILTSIAASNLYSKAVEGYWPLPSAERRKYIDQFAEECGNIFEVRLFDSPIIEPDDIVLSVRDNFCKNFLHYWSSYEYSNAETPMIKDGKYPDTIHFVPFNLYKKFYATFQVK